MKSVHRLTEMTHSGQGGGWAEGNSNIPHGVVGTPADGVDIAGLTIRGIACSEGLRPRLLDNQRVKTRA